MQTNRSGNPNPSKARQAKKRKANLKNGDIKDIQTVLWSAIIKLKEHIEADTNKPDTSELCKLTHALSQSASTYIKALEVGEYEPRLAALEQHYKMEKAA